MQRDHHPFSVLAACPLLLGCMPCACALPTCVLSCLQERAGRAAPQDVGSGQLRFRSIISDSSLPAARPLTVLWCVPADTDIGAMCALAPGASCPTGQEKSGE